MKFEVGQVVAEGQPIVSIAKEGEPEIVVNVPEDQLAAFKASRYKASLTSAPDQTFDVVLRELSPQAAAHDAHVPRSPEARDARGRCRSARARRSSSSAPAGEAPAAAIPAAAITQNKGQPAVWVVRRAGQRAGRNRRPARRLRARLSQRRSARVRAAGR